MTPNAARQRCRARQNEVTPAERVTARAASEGCEVRRASAHLVEHAHVGAALKQQLDDGKMVVHRGVVEGGTTVLKGAGQRGMGASVLPTQSLLSCHEAKTGCPKSEWRLIL